MEALYRPMVVMQTQAKGEWEMILPIISPETGLPMMAAVMKDAEIGDIKTSVVKSISSKPALMDLFAQALEQRIPKATKLPTSKPLLYVDAGLWETVMARKQNPAELAQGGGMLARESIAASSMQARMGLSAPGGSTDFHPQGQPNVNLGARLITGMGQTGLALSGLIEPIHASVPCSTCAS